MVINWLKDLCIYPGFMKCVSGRLPFKFEWINDIIWVEFYVLLFKTWSWLLISPDSWSWLTSLLPNNMGNKRCHSWNEEQCRSTGTHRQLACDSWAPPLDFTNLQVSRASGGANRVCFSSGSTRFRCRFSCGALSQRTDSKNCLVWRWVKKCLSWKSSCPLYCGVVHCGPLSLFPWFPFRILFLTTSSSEALLPHWL